VDIELTMKTYKTLINILC